MSSTPFVLGLPVVDKLTPVSKDTSVVLRARNREDAWYKIRNLQNQMSIKDDIIVYEIGMRPDNPVPVAMHFSEIRIRPGMAESYLMCNLIWGYVHHITGLKDYCRD